MPPTPSNESAADKALNRAKRHPVIAWGIFVAGVVAAVSGLTGHLASVYQSISNLRSPYASELEAVEPLNLLQSRTYFTSQLGISTFSRSIDKDTDLLVELLEPYGIDLPDKPLREDLYVRNGYRVFALSGPQEEILAFGVWSCGSTRFRPALPAMHPLTLNESTLEDVDGNPWFAWNSGNIGAKTFFFVRASEARSQGQQFRAIGQYSNCVGAEEEPNMNLLRPLGDDVDSPLLDFERFAPLTSDQSRIGAPIPEVDASAIQRSLRGNAVFRATDPDLLDLSILLVDVYHRGGIGN